MAPDRVLFSINKEIREYLNKLKKNSTNISAYLRNLILADKAKKKG